MSDITDEYMQGELAKAREYAVVFLLPGPNAATADRSVIWEHGRRNFELRAAGLMNIVGPMKDDGDIEGMCIFNATPDEAAKLMDEDPAVQAGIFTYKIHLLKSFPGDALAG